MFNRKQKSDNKKAEEELRVKYDAFLKEYKELSLKHKIDITAVIGASERGIIPTLKLIQVPDKVEIKTEPKEEPKPKSE